MRKIAVAFTPDELSNVMTAVEHFQDYLADHGTKDYEPMDLMEVEESTSNAYQKLDQAGAEFFSRLRRR